MQTPHKLGISASALFQVTWNDCCQKCFSGGKRVSFCAMPTEMQLQSVVPERVSSGHADRTFGLSLQGCWLHQLPPSVASGRWVLGCPGFSAVCRVPTWDEWAVPKGEERC